MKKNTYYTLLSSLPELPHFDSAQHLPISRERLDQRLNLLQPDDAGQLVCAETLLEWHHQPLVLSHTAAYEHYSQSLAGIRNLTLRALISFRFRLRIIMAALRFEHQHDQCNYQRLATALDFSSRRLLTQAYQTPEVISAQFPWFSKARELVNDNDSLAVERLLMNVVWNYLTSMCPSYGFYVESVFAYVFKWDIIQRWLSYDALRAAQRFHSMQMEIADEYARKAYQ